MLLPAATVNANPSYVEMHTNYGAIELELDGDKAPVTVANFLAYLNEGFYLDTVFHRSPVNFVLQGGGVGRDFQQKTPTHDPIVNEANNGLLNLRGTIAMARTDQPDTATSQFFINIFDNANLDYVSTAKPGYAVFGKVIGGMATVDAANQLPRARNVYSNVPADALIADMPMVDVPSGTPIFIEQMEVLAEALPFASAGPDKKAAEKAAVTLGGVVSDPGGAAITGYQWTQTLGPTVELTGADTATPRFTAPGVAADTVLEFQLVATNDQGKSSAADKARVTVQYTNAIPSFTKGADQTISEDAGAQSVPGWATAISAGEAESSQTLNFILGNDNPSLFAVQPAIVANGTLTYAPAANQFGTATVTVTLRDNGGTANGGVDATAPQTFTITVNPVNDAPSFTKGADQGGNPGTAQRTVIGWATGLAKGPANESGQALSFIATNDNNALFQVQPSVDANGNLSYTPAANKTGAAKVTLWARDNGGVANGGVDTSAAQTFNIVIFTPPTANAGPDQPEVPEKSLVRLNGSGQAGSSPIAGFAWNQSAGPKVVLSGANTQTAQFTAPTVNVDTVLGFDLVVTDAAGRTSSADTVNITVRDNPAHTPHANAGTDIAVEGGATVVLDGGTSSDPDAGQTATLKYQWTAPAGITLSDAAAKKPSFTAPVLGADLAFKLVVTDADGNQSAPATANVKVSRKNTAPEAHASALGGNGVRVGAVKTLDGGASFDADGNPIAFLWTAPAGIALSSATAAKPTFTAPASAIGQTLVFSLKVNDGKLDSVPSAVSVQVNGDNSPPNLSIDSVPVKEGDQVTLNVVASDPDGDAIATYLWQQMGGTPVVLGAVDGPSLSFTAPAVGAGGRLSFKLTATDGYAPNPKSTTDDIGLTVDNDPSLLDCSAAFAAPKSLWPANKAFKPVGIKGVTGPDAFNLKITGIASDEPVKNKAAKDNTAPDAKIKRGKATAKKPQAVDTALLRAERQNGAAGNGRVYTVRFEASDGAQTCAGAVKVGVPPTKGAAAVEDGVQ